MASLDFSTFRVFRRLNPRQYWLNIFIAALIIFLINRWPIHEQLSSGFIKGLALLVALPITFLIWLSTAKKIALPWLIFIYGALTTIIGIFVEYLVYQKSPQNPASLLFYGIVLSIGIATVVSSFVPKLDRNKDGSVGRYLTAPVFVIVLVLLLLPIVKASFAQGLGTNTPSSSAPISNQVQAIDAFKLFNAINTERVQKNLTPLSFNYQLESAAQAIIQASPQPASGTQVEASVKQQGYQYSKVGAVYGTFPGDQTETQVVSSMSSQYSTQPLFADNTYSDVGIATQLVAGSNAVEIVLGAPLQAAPKTEVIVETPQPQPSTPQVPQAQLFTGVELFAAVNQSRVNHGVNPLQQRDELCTVASIRLNQQLQIGQLDNHAGFDGVLATYKDQLSSYSHIAENLAEGYDTAQDTVTAWEGSPGHAVLLKDGSYVWGCTAANHGFSVLIAAY